MSKDTYSAKQLGINPRFISDNAVTVVRALQEAGFDGYLVGGCVRDLILGKKPKDFDVTTNAKPEQVKEIFRRSRIIGRRFKIVHVKFGREIIEVATYRSNPSNGKKKFGFFKKKPTQSKSGRILDDNVYGTIVEDARRRDFTVNALYYDPINDQILDFLNGIEDANTGRLELIGEPDKRFAEDPVRMLRVIRFQAKLGLKISPQMDSALRKSGHLLEEVPAARLFDEVLKLFHHAHAVKSWEGLKEFEFLNYLFPTTLAFLHDEGNGSYEHLILKSLYNTDQRILVNKPVIPSFLFCVLLWKSFSHEFNQIRQHHTHIGEAIWAAGDAVFGRQSPRIAIPRRVSVPAIEIWELQGILENRRPRTIKRVLGNRRFRAAYDFLVLRADNDEVNSEISAWWTRIQEVNESEKGQMISDLSHGARRGRRSSKSNSNSNSHFKPGSSAGSQVASHPESKPSPKPKPKIKRKRRRNGNHSSHESNRQVEVNGNRIQKPLHEPDGNR